MKISCVMMLAMSMLVFCGCGDSRGRLDINIEKGDSVVTMQLIGASNSPDGCVLYEDVANR